MHQGTHHSTQVIGIKHNEIQSHLKNGKTGESPRGPAGRLLLTFVWGFRKRQILKNSTSPFIFVVIFSSSDREADAS